MKRGCQSNRARTSGKAGTKPEIGTRLRLASARQEAEAGVGNAEAGLQTLGFFLYLSSSIAVAQSSTNRLKTLRRGLVNSGLKARAWR